ncbi:Chaperone protein DnaJ [Porphyridium purpureum]|uniref:Chaperone protein DnaJ n=1 Tax=Porphyridium purpureum TaxID=35688 RepID=A0A5J4YNY1_PORPP|nr:Chaperone protein DnaJ [Porphyridium purpureum]|eukprot:POR3584..scf295_9
MDPHRVLGVSAGASDAEVRDAYKRAVRKWHPDTNRQGGKVARDEAERMIREVNSAYERVCEWRQHAKSASQDMGAGSGAGASGMYGSRDGARRRGTGFYAGSAGTAGAGRGAQYADFSSQYARYEHESRMNWSRYEHAGGAEGYHARTAATYVSNMRRGFALLVACSVPIVYFNWKAQQTFTYAEKYGTAAAQKYQEQSLKHSPNASTQPRFGKKD